MAISFVSISSDAATGTSPSISEPSGTMAGDCIVALYLVDAASATLTIPTGWTSLFNGITAGSLILYNFCYIVRGASAPSYSFTHTGSVYRELHVLSYNGTDPINPIDSVATFVRTTSTSFPQMIPPNILTVSNAAMVIEGAACWSGGTYNTPSTNYTIRTPVSERGVIEDRLLATAGAETPSYISGVGTSTTDIILMTIALAPPNPITATAWFVA
jgi:hypothetical protein